MKFILLLSLGSVLAFAQSVSPPPSSGGGAPSGPAGGDLGGTYPNPTTTNLSHVTNGSLPTTGMAGGVNSAVYSTSAGGAAQLSATLPSGLTIPGPTLTAPAIGAATGSSLTVTGALTAGNGSGAAGALDLGQGTLPALGTTAVSFFAPTSVTSYGLLYPGAAPAANQFLVWGTPASGISTGLFNGVSSPLAFSGGNLGCATCVSSSSPTLTTPTFTTSATLNNAGIGTSSAAGYIAQNTTAAGAGAQQFSPRAFDAIGQGWKTNATAASQSVEFYGETQPLQGAANPDGYLVISEVVNGGSAVPIVQFGYKPQLSGQQAIYMGNVTPSTTNYSMLYDGTHIYLNAPSGGSLFFQANAGTNTAKIDGTYLRMLNGKGLLSDTDGGSSIGFSNAANRFANGWFKVEVFVAEVAVASLPTCNAANGGARASVNDATQTLTAGIGATVAGTGSNHVPVYCNGTNWLIG